MAKITYTSDTTGTDSFMPSGSYSLTTEYIWGAPLIIVNYETADSYGISKIAFMGTNLKADQYGFISGTITYFAAYLPSERVALSITDLNLRAFNVNLYMGGDVVEGALLSGNDVITGTSGADTFRSGAGNDTVRGGAGDDIFRDGSGRDTYDGGSGIDTADYSMVQFDSWHDTKGITANLLTGKVVDPWGYTDTLISIERIAGTHNADTLTGSNKNSAEYFRGLAGNDTINGGGGTQDWVDYSAEAWLGGRSGVKVDLAKGKATDSFGDTDKLLNIENVIGTSSADSLTGNSRFNHLRGDGGNDVIRGNGGGDILEGGDGNDTLIGTKGSQDYFSFIDRGFFSGASSLGTDRIKSFRDGEDRIMFQDIDGIDSRADLRLVQSGANVIITYDTDKIIVENITVSKLTAADFVIL